MVITYHGLFFVKIQHGDLVIAFNPPALKEARPVRFGADLVLVSLNDERFNGVESLGRGDKQPLVIAGPGEYEVRGVFIKGLQTAGPVSGKAGSGQKINTVYLVTVDGVQLVHLGGLSEPESFLEQREELGQVDILFAPIDPSGGDGFIDAKQVAKISRDLEAKLVVPLGQEIKGFLKEMGLERAESVPSLVFRKKDVALKTGEVVLIQS